MGNQHIVPNSDGWAVKGEGNSKVTERFDNKEDAIEEAKEIAENQESEVIEHNENGKITSKDSYGNDKYPPKDNEY